MVEPIFFGTIGMFLILLAFVLNLRRIITQDSIHYCALNIFGAGIIAYYAYLIDSPPFLILNSIWAISAAYKFMEMVLNFKK